MASRVRVTDEQLIDAARTVFLRDGVDATASAVAAQAGVSEALIFKRFGTRDALIARAMQSSRPAWVAELDVPSDDLREHLERVAHGMIASMRAEMPRTMLSWSRKPGELFNHIPGEPPPVAGMKVLSAWFEREMRAGRMRPSDPEILARVFSGAIVAFSMAEMTGLALHMPLATTTFVRGLVDALWFGAAPTPQP